MIIIKYIYILHVKYVSACSMVWVVNDYFINSYSTQRCFRIFSSKHFKPIETMTSLLYIHCSTFDHKKCLLHIGENWLNLPLFILRQPLFNLRLVSNHINVFAVDGSCDFFCHAFFLKIVSEHCAKSGMLNLVIRFFWRSRSIRCSRSQNHSTSILSRGKRIHMFCGLGYK